MSESAHETVRATRRPWRLVQPDEVESIEAGTGADEIALVTEDGQVTIAAVWPQQGGDDAEQRANAELLARAANAHEELLAALKFVGVEMVEGPRENSRRSVREWREAILKRIEAAVARGEGRA